MNNMNDMTTGELESFVEWEYNQILHLQQFVNTAASFIRQYGRWGLSKEALGPILGFGILCEILIHVHRASADDKLKIVYEEQGQIEVPYKVGFVSEGDIPQCVDEGKYPDFNGFGVANYSDIKDLAGSIKDKE